MGEIGNDRVARFTALIERERETLDELAQRVADGETLAEVCAGWDVPYSRFMAWLCAEAGRAGQYAAALRMRADSLVAETIGIADTQVEPGGQLDNPRDKLRIETRLRVAAKWDPQRFGDSEYVPPPRRALAEMPMLEAARQVAFAMAQGAQIVERQRREPRLIEAKAEVQPQAGQTAVEQAGVGEI